MKKPAVTRIYMVPSRRYLCFDRADDAEGIEASLASRKLALALLIVLGCAHQNLVKVRSNLIQINPGRLVI